ncbi:MAG: Usg family protein, partial [Candidatus Adlerbacteria bacterium]|nr:Usg family protein [Candidatus Adlerbacteria bacterium]
MVSKDFRRQLEGYGLTTADICYRLPDYRDILQTYIWQGYDMHP